MAISTMLTIISTYDSHLHSPRSPRKKEGKRNWILLLPLENDRDIEIKKKTYGFCVYFLYILDKRKTMYESINLVKIKFGVLNSNILN